jgi:hypothetical protein
MVGGPASWELRYSLAVLGDGVQGRCSNEGRDKLWGRVYGGKKKKRRRREGGRWY